MIILTYETWRGSPWRTMHGLPCLAQRPRLRTEASGLRPAMEIPGLRRSEPSRQDLRETLQGLADLIKIGQVSSVVQDFGIPDLAGFVDHERGTFSNSLESDEVVIVRAVGLAHLTVEIAEQREVQILFVLPLLLRKWAIHTDSQDLSIEIGIVAEVVPHRTEFGGTHASKGKRHK